MPVAPGVRRLAAALFLLSVPLTAQAFVSGPTTIALSPSVPRAGDIVMVTITGRSDSCLPRNAVATVDGQTVTIRVSEHPECGACLALSQPYTLQVGVTLPPTPDIYDLRYVATDDCAGTSRLVASQQFVSAPAPLGTTMFLSPAKPKPGEPVHVTVVSSWTDSCVPRSATVVMDGHTISIEARIAPCNLSCLAAVFSYSVTTDFVAPLEPGEYTLEYNVTDCRSRRVPMASRQLPIFQSCDFGRSLAVDRASVGLRDPFTLTWCDPSFLVGTDNAFTVSFYRVYTSSTVDGPFHAVADVQGAANTRLTVTPVETGTNYYYVEAHGCHVTIAGPQCPLDTLLLSNIVTVKSGSLSCVPDGATLCLQGGRFKVTATTSGRAAAAVQFTDESGYFWFFTPTNVEVTVKVLKPCPKIWVFAAGMTNVGVELTVVDTLRGTSRRYSNPAATPFAPILDTSAFNCP